VCCASLKCNYEAIDNAVTHRWYEEAVGYRREVIAMLEALEEFDCGAVGGFSPEITVKTVDFTTRVNFILKKYYKKS
jgi:hypothetical protein